MPERENSRIFNALEGLFGGADVAFVCAQGIRKSGNAEFVTLVPDFTSDQEAAVKLTATGVIDQYAQLITETGA